MTRYEDDYEYDDQPRRRAPRTLTREERSAYRQNTIINMMVAGLIAGVIFLAWPFLAEMFKVRAGIIPAPTAQPSGTNPAIGNQAPPAVRSTNGYRPAAAPALPDVAQNEATAQVEYQSAIEAQNSTAPATPLPVALPLNSAGAPIIDQRQQQQLDQSAQLAAQEAAEAQRRAQLADAASRPPDVSAQEVATMTGRNPCSVPRADPATCATGLYKPTPVQVQP